MTQATRLAGRRIVAIGGGHGLSRALQGLRHEGAEPTAVVTVADDGGSSGRLRRDLDIIALGDLRMALLALSTRPDVAALLGHRFGRGELRGHSLGNLGLLALAEQAGDDFTAALYAMAALLRCAGRVVPATMTPVELQARATTGVLEGQVRVGSAEGRIERVWLEPADPPATVDAVRAIQHAEAVVLAPGSLFTSVIATLLVPEIGRAVAAHQLVVVVANITTQPGETSGLDLGAHLQALTDHVPGMAVDSVIVHDGPVPGGTGLGTEVPGGLARRVVRADVCARDAAGAPIAAHDAARTGAAIVDAIDGG